MTDSPARYATSGGFIPPLRTSLPSPAPSTASSRAAASLPHPRSKPLLPGSRKEDYAREYVSSRLMHISRRYVKKHGIPDPADTVTGYEDFGQVCKDMEEVIDVLWFSGTPSLQTPYLLNIALSIAEYIPSFPPDPRPTFALLKKLDHCFSSLLSGHDIRTNEPLPGCGASKRSMSNTDMVRLKSLVDQTRLQVASVMSGEEDVDTWLPEGDEDVTQASASGAAALGQKPSHSETKRKHPGDEEEADEEVEPPKRQRTESPPPQFKHEAYRESPIPVDPPHVKREDSDSHQGQFHFALEEDNDDDEDDNEQRNEDVDTAGDVLAEPKKPKTPPGSAQPNGGEDSEGVTEAEGTPRDHRDASDEEEEELQMNVAKVYEKTIVQLGKVLGESIVGNWTRE